MAVTYDFKQKVITKLFKGKSVVKNGISVFGKKLLNAKKGIEITYNHPLKTIHCFCLF